MVLIFRQRCCVTSRKKRNLYSHNNFYKTLKKHSYQGFSNISPQHNLRVYTLAAGIRSKNIRPLGIRGSATFVLAHSWLSHIRPTGIRSSATFVLAHSWLRHIRPSDIRASPHHLTRSTPSIIGLKDELESELDLDGSIKKL